MRETYKKIHVSASGSYDIIIGDGQLARLGEHVRPLLGDCRIAVLTDSNVDALYGTTILEVLGAAGYDACKYVIPAGEASKSAENLLAFLDFLARNRFTRSDAIVAFGGGVVGDLGGLTASLYLRGVSYIQVPTTLLAAVDSSVGGKTAIDIPAGKNLVGAFYQPRLVCCDTRLMDTLPADIYRDGCAEVIKYGVILDAALYDTLQTPPFDRIETVARCVGGRIRQRQARAAQLRPHIRARHRKVEPLCSFPRLGCGKRNGHCSKDSPALRTCRHCRVPHRTARQIRIRPQLPLQRRGAIRRDAQRQETPRWQAYTCASPLCGRVHTRVNARGRGF